jgi:hypothetical protein
MRLEFLGHENANLQKRLEFLELENIALKEELRAGKERCSGWGEQATASLEEVKTPPLLQLHPCSTTGIKYPSESSPIRSAPQTLRPSDLWL